MKGHSQHILLCVLALTFHLLPFTSLKAQVAGLNTLTLLDLGSAARTSGIGFDYLSVYAADATLALDNPSLLHRDMSRTASLSVVTLFEGGAMGSLSYVHDFGRIGPMQFAFRFYNYGSFRAFDEEETAQGEFNAADYALSIYEGAAGPLVLKARIALLKDTNDFLQTGEHFLKAFISKILSIHCKYLLIKQDYPTGLSASLTRTMQSHRRSPQVATRVVYGA